MNDPILVWTAIGVVTQIVQTIFIMITGIVVFFQIRQIRQESIEKKISGLRAALDILDTDLFNQASRQAKEKIVVHGFKWRRLLEDINVVATLVSEKWTDEKLLFMLKGDELAAIGEYIQGNRLPADLKDELTGQYKPAVDLMCRASKLIRRN